MILSSDIERPHSNNYLEQEMSIHPTDKECHVLYMMYSDIIGKCMVVS
jgi:hypothetical protein